MTPGSDALLAFAVPSPVGAALTIRTTLHPQGFVAPARPHAPFIQGPVPPPPNSAA
jgi:hypothetical protein